MLAGVGLVGVLGTLGLVIALAAGGTGAPKVAESVSDLAVQIGRRYGAEPKLVQAVISMAKRLHTEPMWMAALIDLESEWKFDAVNPASGAYGFIQITDKTAEWLGLTMEELKAMDAFEQLEWVETYFVRTAAGEHYDDPRAMPLNTLKSLSFTVFWPVARDWKRDRELPAWIQNGNPGVVIVGDYVDAVRRRLLEVT